MWAGFGSTDINLIYERVQPTFNNVMYYDAKENTLGDLTQNVAWKSSAVGSGYVYFGTQAGSESGNKEIFFPAVALREAGSGEYRASVQNNAVFCGLQQRCRRVLFNIIRYSLPEICQLIIYI